MGELLDKGELKMVDQKMDDKKFQVKNGRPCAKTYKMLAVHTVKFSIQASGFY